MMALSHHIFMQSSYSSLQLCDLSTYAAYRVYLFNSLSRPIDPHHATHFSLLKYICQISAAIYKKIIILQEHWWIDLQLEAHNGWIYACVETENEAAGLLHTYKYKDLVFIFVASCLS
jgi:hypothetical protein